MLLRRIWRGVKGSLKKDDFHAFLYRLVGEPNNIELYKLAFRHKSASIFREHQKLNNERLEYLGDAILGAIVADMLYGYFPGQKEGFLSKVRSRIVNRKRLNLVGRKLGFRKYLLLNGTFSNNIYGNAVEAFIGALYLDKGFEATKSFVRGIVSKYVDIEDFGKQDENYKSKLIEWGQHKRKDIIFNTEEREQFGLPLFHTEIFIEDKIFGKGEAKSKKYSQQKAAKAAFILLKSKPEML